MKLIINTQKFSQAIKATERMIGKNISLPILSTILLETDKGHLVLSATNLEQGIKYTIGAKVEKEGKVAIPAKILSEFIVNIQDEKITLSCTKEVLSVSSTNYKTTILGMKTNEFPIIPTPNKDIVIQMEPKDLSKAIGSVVEAVASSETRPELTGVLITGNSKELSFAATDSYRLSEYVVKRQGEFTGSYIVPHTTALEMMRLSEGQESVEIALSQSQIGLRGSQFELVSRLIDGQYPDYKKVIPQTRESEAVVNKSELERAIRLAGVFSSSIADLQLAVSTQGIKIASKNSDRGEVLANIPAELKGEDFMISVNYRYFLDGLKIISSQDVILCYTGEAGPLLLNDIEDKNINYIIMPLRS